MAIGSLRVNGGAFSQAHVYVNMNGRRPDRPMVSRDLGITVVPSARDRLIPHLSKVTAVNRLPGGDDRSHVLAMDHDVIVLDLSRLAGLLGERVAARVNNKSDLPRCLGAAYESSLGTLGANWARTTYVNSGVVLLPEGMRETVTSAWSTWARRIYTHVASHPVAEQVGLSIALNRLGIPYTELPPTLNRTNWGVLPDNAGIIHYNDADPENRMLKRSYLTSLTAFQEFVARSQSRFWLVYGQRVAQFADVNRSALTELVRFLADER